jgi:hypothetical protein
VSDSIELLYILIKQNFFLTTSTQLKPAKKKEKEEGKQAEV